MADTTKKLLKQLEALHNAKRDLKDRPKNKLKAKKQSPPPAPKPLMATAPPQSTLPPPQSTLPPLPVSGYYDHYDTEGMNLMGPDFGQPQGPGAAGGWHSIASRAKAKQTKDTMKGLENYNGGKQAGDDDWLGELYGTKHEKAEKNRPYQAMYHAVSDDAFADMHIDANREGPTTGLTVPTNLINPTGQVVLGEGTLYGLRQFFGPGRRGVPRTPFSKAILGGLRKWLPPVEAAMGGLEAYGDVSNANAVYGELIRAWKAGGQQGPKPVWGDIMAQNYAARGEALAQDFENIPDWLRGVAEPFYASGMMFNPYTIGSLPYAAHYQSDRALSEFGQLHENVNPSLKVDPLVSQLGVGGDYAADLSNLSPRMRNRLAQLAEHQDQEQYLSNHKTPYAADIPGGWQRFIPLAAASAAAPRSYPRWDNYILNPLQNAVAKLIVGRPFTKGEDNATYSNLIRARDAGELTQDQLDQIVARTGLEGARSRYEHPADPEKSRAKQEMHQREIQRDRALKH